MRIAPALQLPIALSVTACGFRFTGLAGTGLTSARSGAAVAGSGTFAEDERAVAEFIQPDLSGACTVQPRP